MMTTQAQNIFTRILFIALLPVALFACGDESDYMAEGELAEEGALMDDASLEQVEDMMISYADPEDWDSEPQDPLECILSCVQEYNDCLEERRERAKRHYENLRREYGLRPFSVPYPYSIRSYQALCKPKQNSCIDDCLD